MVESYPLYWPEGYERTDPTRRIYGPFKTGFAQSRDSLLEEVARLGGKLVVLSTNVRLGANGLPRGDQAEPKDPGVAIYFTWQGEPRSFACDRYRLVRWNLRALALTINAFRGIERWGASGMMRRAFKGFIAITDQRKPWREVLGFTPAENVTGDKVVAAYKRLAQIRHPDGGGTPEQFQELVSARDAALRELGL